MAADSHTGGVNVRAAGVGPRLRATPPEQPHVYEHGGRISDLISFTDISSQQHSFLWESCDLFRSSLKKRSPSARGPPLAAPPGGGHGQYRRILDFKSLNSDLSPLRGTRSDRMLKCGLCNLFCDLLTSPPLELRGLTSLSGQRTSPDDSLAISDSLI